MTMNHLAALQAQRPPPAWLPIWFHAAVTGPEPVPPLPPEVEPPPAERSPETPPEIREPDQPGVNSPIRFTPIHFNPIASLTPRNLP